MSENLPLCPTGHRPFGAADQKRGKEEKRKRKQKKKKRKKETRKKERIKTEKERKKVRKKKKEWLKDEITTMILMFFFSYAAADQYDKKHLPRLYNQQFLKWWSASSNHFLSLWGKQGDDPRVKPFLGSVPEGDDVLYYLGNKYTDSWGKVSLFTHWMKYIIK